MTSMLDMCYEVGAKKRGITLEEYKKYLGITYKLPKRNIS